MKLKVGDKVQNKNGTQGVVFAQDGLMSLVSFPGGISGWFSTEGDGRLEPVDE